MGQNTEPNEQRTIGYIEGRLEGLATKAFVQDAIQIAIDKQAEKIDQQTSQLTNEIKGVRNTQTKTIGVAVGIGFVLSLAIGVGNLAVNFGLV